MIPGRELYWQITNKWLFYVISLLLAFIIISIFAYYFYIWKKAQTNKTLKTYLSIKAFLIMVRDAIFGLKIVKGQVSAGIMHILIFWGSLILFIGTTLLSVHEHLYPFISGSVYILFSSLMEIGGLMLLGGVLFALFRRYVQNVSRLEKRIEDLIIPLWLGVIVLSGFVLESLRLRFNSPDFEKWSFVGWWLKGLLPDWPIQVIYPYFWWGHAIISFGFMLFIPLSKMFHIVGAPLSIYLHNLPKLSHEERSSEEIEKGCGEDYEESDLPDTDEMIVKDMDLQSLVFLDGCMRCGRCVEVCPSNGVKEAYSPRDFVQAMRAIIWEKNSPLGDIRPLKNHIKKEMLQNIWHCTTCRACLEVCPVYGPTFQLVLGQRSLAVEEGTLVPDILNQTLERLYKYENPWVSSKKEKLGWIEENMDIKLLSDSKGDQDICYFVGCTTSVDARARSIARSFIRIMKKAGIEFGVFGDKEPCCGDIAKRVGEYGLFEEKKQSCLELFERFNIKDIVTSSPHCYYTFKNDYPKTDLKVYHYTLFLHKLLNEQKLKFSYSLNFTVTYHDPCYLGRHSRIFDEPRDIIKSIPGIRLVEMLHNREDSLCCGGGGGRMWQGNELYGESRMSERRAKEAIDTKADIIITACPLCLIMMEDAIKTLGYDKKMKVMDLNELVLMAIEN